MKQTNRSLQITNNVPGKISHAYYVRRIIAIVAVVFPFFVAQCSRTTWRVEGGLDLLFQGKLDAAFSILESAYKSDPTNPTTMGALGLVLTYKRISLLMGLDLMEKSLAKERNPMIRRELYYLYLDLGEYNKAKALLESSKMTIDEYITPEMKISRLGTSCLAKGEIDALRKEPYEIGLKKYLLIRCLLSLPTRPDRVKELTELWEGLTEASYICMLVAQEDLPLTFRAPTLSKCKKDFPQIPSIQRDRTGKLIANATDKTPYLFQDNLFEPGIPRADVWEIQEPSMNVAPEGQSSLP